MTRRIGRHFLCRVLAGRTRREAPQQWTPAAKRLMDAVLLSDGRDRYSVQLWRDKLQSGSAPRRDDGWRWRNPIRGRYQDVVGLLELFTLLPLQADRNVGNAPV